MRLAGRERLLDRYDVDNVLYEFFRCIFFYCYLLRGRDTSIREFVIALRGSGKHSGRPTLSRVRYARLHVVFTQPGALQDF